jgi:glycosyltransferase involved in cell wall biosynthesis
VLWVQRRRWPIPRRLRAVARELLGRTRSAHDHDGSPVDDWSRPLIERGYDHAAARIPELTDAPPTQLFGVTKAAPRTTATGSAGLRCLIVTKVLDAGGIDEFVAFLARRLPAFGIETTVARTSIPDSDRHAGGLLAASLHREGIPIAEISDSDAREWLARNRPDVISAHAPTEWLLDAAETLDVPVVETLHGVPTPIGTDWATERARAGHITMFVAVSELVRRQYLAGNSGFPAGAIVTIPNAFNDTHRAPVDRARAREWLGLEDEFLFVSLARHSLQKNAFGLVDAFADVARARPRAHLLVAGRVDDLIYTEQVRSLRDRSPARGHIHLRDNSSHPSAVLAAADGFVLDSFFEGWPLASMEALCAGLPIVMSEVGGAREQVGERGEYGYIVPNPLGDPERVSWERAGRERFRSQVNRDDLAAALTAVVDTRERWAAARGALAEHSARRFDAAACAGAHAAILTQAAAIGRGRRPVADLRR